MISNFSKVILGGICIATMLLTAGSAKATTIDSSDYFALVNPGNPADGPDDTAELNDILATYYPQGSGTYTVDPTTWGSPGYYDITINSLGTLPSATATLAIDQSQTGTSFSINLGIYNYDYLMVKWDGRDVFYKISGLTGQLDLVNDLVFNQNGVAQDASGFKLFNQHDNPDDPDPTVPDGGSTIALLGLALVGADYLRRKMIKA